MIEVKEKPTAVDLLGEEKVLRHNLITAATSRANGDPLPGPLAAAFCEGAIRIGSSGLLVRKVVANDWVIFKKVNSPMLRLIEELNQAAGKLDHPAPDVAMTDEEEFELCYQFTRPISEVRSVLNQGLEKFKNAALVSIGDLHSDIVVKLITAAIVEQIKRAWQTANQYAGEMKEDGEVTFFRDTNPEPGTASAGG